MPRDASRRPYRLFGQRTQLLRQYRLIPALNLLAVTAAYSQTAPHPVFEVASVKPGGNTFSTRPNRLPGRIRWTTQLNYLVGYAYHLDFSRVSGPHLGSVAATIPEAGVIAITGRGASTLQLAETLQRSIGGPVWDRTGLQGNYDFAFRFAQGLSADLKTDAPSLATALKENLGLTMKKQKGPLETLVIDYIEEPSAN